MIEIVEPGWGTTFQDLGRPGYADLGVSRSGAVDLETAARMNRLVGNLVDAALLETLGGLVIVARSAVVVATSSDDARHSLVAAQRLRIDPAPGDVWGYLAVRGGFAIEPVFGSRSHDTASGLGPPPPGPRTTVGIAGLHRAGELLADRAQHRRREDPIRVWPGPRHEWFRDVMATLIGRSWTVGGAASRIGVRLSAGPFERADTGVPSTMPSEGLVAGAIQITPSGEPIVMLADHPTTGGYPVVAVVDPGDLGRIAQLPTGSSVRFVVA